MSTVRVRKPRKIRISRATGRRFIGTVHSLTLQKQRESPELFSARKSFSSIRSAYVWHACPSVILMPGITPGPCHQYRKDQNKKQSRRRLPAATRCLLSLQEDRMLNPPVWVDQILRTVTGR